MLEAVGDVEGAKDARRKLREQRKAYRDYSEGRGLDVHDDRLTVVKVKNGDASYRNIYSSGLTESGGSGIIESNLKDVLYSKIADGSITLKLNDAMQKPHMFDTRKEGKSYFTISLEELQKIINEKSGTGEIRIYNNGQIKETIEYYKDIGFDVSLSDQKETSTNRFTIHYSKSRTHAVPSRRKK